MRFIGGNAYIKEDPNSNTVKENKEILNPELADGNNKVWLSTEIYKLGQIFRETLLTLEKLKEF